MKIKYSLFLVFVFAIFMSIEFFLNITLDNKVSAISNNNTTGIEFESLLSSTTTSSNNLSIIYPVYVEHFNQVIKKNFNEKQLQEKSSVIKENENQNTTVGSFSGNGILKGNIDIQVNGTAKVTSLDNMSVFISGIAEFTARTTGDRAPYTFQAIGHYNKDGSFNSGGSMFFNSTIITGDELSSLKNTVGIFKDIVDKDGNGTFLMWRWE